MKQAIILLAITLLFTPKSKAQTFALSTSTTNKTFTGYSTTNFINYRSGGGIGDLTKAGIIVSGAGIVTGVVGAFLFLANASDRSDPNQRNTGGNVFIAGGVIGGIGLLMSIGGAIYDVTEYRKARFGLIAPKRNEIGLAYKF